MIAYLLIYLCDHKKRGGGILLAVNQSVRSIINIAENIEALSVQLYYTVSVLYMSHWTALTPKENLLSYLSDTIPSSGKTFVVGDFNCKCPDIDRSTLFSDYNFSTSSGFPIHFHPSHWLYSTYPF